MHDRYFYLADALTIAYAIMNPRRWYLPVLVVTSSFGAYLTFLWKFEPVPLAGLALLMAAALVVIARDTFAGRDRVETPAEIEPRTRPSFSRLADSQVVRFSVIGGVCTIAYLALYVALREVMAPLVANALALSLTAAFNFAANRRWTFAMIEKPLAWQALEYSGAYLIGLAASTVALAVAMDVAGPSPRYLETALALAASVFATLTRFVLMRWVVFAERPLRRARTASRGSAAVPAPTLPRSRPT